MSIKRDSELKYPYEYILAQIEFGSKLVALTNETPKRIFGQYTSIYITLTNGRFFNTDENFWIKDVMEKLDKYLVKYKSPKTLAKKVYELYLTIPLDKPISSTNPFGCFVLNTADYYRERGEIRLHFSPIRKGLTQRKPELRVSDLSSVYLPERIAEFTKMINYIYENKEDYKDVKYFVSSSWLQNIPAYKSLFPDVPRTKVENGYWWLWGQFLKWDFTGNKDRVNEFVRNLKKAKIVEEAIDAIPFHIYEVRVPLELMFEKYVLTNKKHDTYIPAAVKSLN